jgi:hypothetical protein
MRQGTFRDEPTSQETEEVANLNSMGLPLEDSARSAQKYIDIYFNDFHPAWPFLHQGTFKLPEEPCVLLQSMLMIGLWIKGDDTDREKAMTFHHKLLASIEAQRVHISALIALSSGC